jgi:bifunctional non-homologous end joining protein LigD
LPGFVAPQLATLVDEAPEGDGWLHELKYDGYRMLARLEDGQVTWFSRNGLDWTARFDMLSPAIARLPAGEALLDGEVVVLDEKGVSRFHDLQQALSEGGSTKLTYFAFDLLHLDGLDLRRCALVDRKAVLQALLARTTRRSRVQYSAHIVGSGQELVAQACRTDLEGIVSKRVDAGYVSGRTRDWVKTKCGMRQEFVVAGFTQPTGSRVGIGSLVLGVHEKGKLRHAGRVGAGIGRALLVKLRRQLGALAIDHPPFDAPLDSAARRGVTWVKPKLVVEVTFTGWTRDGALRHPSFEGVREDKRPAEVVKEVPKSELRGSAGRSGARRTKRDPARRRKNTRR